MSARATERADPTTADSLLVGPVEFHATESSVRGVMIGMLDATGDAVGFLTIDPVGARAMARELIEAADAVEGGEELDVLRSADVRPS